MSILSRKRDLSYLLFFAIHVPIIFRKACTLLYTTVPILMKNTVVDAYPLWPTSLRPAFMDDIRSFYITTYKDQFFISPPSWFRMYIYMELLYHVPLSLWAIGALLRGESVMSLRDRVVRLIGWNDR
jgi:hypothetical protein